MKVVVCLGWPVDRDEQAALEMAARLGSEVSFLALATGGSDQDRALAAARAAGASRTMRIEGEPLASAGFHSRGRVLAAAALRLEADVVLTGASSGDEDREAVAGAVAEHLDAFHVACIRSLEVRGEKEVLVRVRAGGKLRRLVVPCPAVFSVRGYAEVSSQSELPGDAEALSLSELGLDPQVVRPREPLLGQLVPESRPTRIAGSPEELARLLRDG